MRLGARGARALKALLLLAAAAFALAIAVLYGMLAYRNHLPPFEIVRSLERRRQSASRAEAAPRPVAAESADLPGTDVAALIGISRPEDVAEKRRALISLLWGTGALPAALPSAVTRDFEDARYDLIPGLSRIDRLVVGMEFGLESVLYHFVPVSPNGRSVLYYGGHDGGFLKERPQIVTLLEHGYGVVGLSMPLLEPNNQPVVTVPRFGRLRLASHRWMKFLRPPSGHPLKYFIEPVVVAVNYLEKTVGSRGISMVGISGGGWATTVAAAVDTRIGLSFPVAGSYPLHLRQEGELGDYEESVPALHDVANYPELYVLGSAGEGRKQLQILNRFDPCCFGGTRWTTYRDVVSARVRSLGPGSFDVFMDESHQKHRISRVAVARILDELGRTP